MISNKLIFPRNIYFRRYRKKTVFKSGLKTILFLKILILYFRINWHKNDFSKCSKNNTIFLEILILLDIWTKKTILSKRSEEKYIYLEFGNFGWLSGYVNIFSYMGKKLFFWSNLQKKNALSSKCWYLHRYPIFRIRGSIENMKA